jgi:hypothetical protein
LKALCALGVLLVSGISALGSVTINLGADKLFQSNGTTPIPQGALIQLVASTTDSTFTLPTASSFVGGSADDVVLASFGSGPNGTVAQPIVFSLSSFANLTPGDPLMLRWWPTLTTSSVAPGFTTFGQFRTDAVENFSNTGWFVPADGSTITLNFLDQAAMGSEPNSAGTASFTTGAAVPEPSTWAAAILVGGALVFHARRRCVTG